MKNRALLSLTSGILALSLSFPAFTAAPKTVDTICASNAVSARDIVIANSYTNFAQNITNAYNTRRDALRSAWLITDENNRKNSVKAAWANFKTASKAAKRSWDLSTKNAWSNFRNAAKNCSNMERSLESNESLDHF